MNKQELEEKYGHLKEAFFALYWGQEIVRINNWYSIPVCPNTLFEAVKITKRIDLSYLQLKPLSSITINDSVELSKFRYRDSFSISDDYSYFLKNKYDSEQIVNYYKEKVFKYESIIKRLGSGAVDYLRSKGYALPFMGIPVEQQITMGWCKVD